MAPPASELSLAPWDGQIYEVGAAPFLSTTNDGSGPPATVNAWSQGAYEIGEQENFRHQQYLHILAASGAHPDADLAPDIRFAGGMMLVPGVHEYEYDIDGGEVLDGGKGAGACQAADSRCSRTG